MALARRVERSGSAALRSEPPGLRGPRRSFRPAARRGRPVIRRVAAALCLLLALYCLVAAAATLSAQTIPGEPDPKKLPESPRGPLPLLIPLVFLACLVVVAGVGRRGRNRPDRQDAAGRRVGH
jgi:hypothetical protein